MEEGVEVLGNGDQSSMLAQNPPTSTENAADTSSGRVPLPKRHQQAEPSSISSTENPSGVIATARHDEDEDSKRRRLNRDTENFHRRSRSAGRQYRNRGAEESDSDGEPTRAAAPGGNEASSPSAPVATNEDSLEVDLAAAVEAMEDDEDSRSSPPPLADAAPAPRTLRLPDMSSTDDTSSSSSPENARGADDGDSDDDSDSDDGRARAIFRPLRRRGRGAVADLEAQPAPEFLGKKPRKENFFLPAEIMKRCYGTGAGRRHNDLGEKFYSSVNVVKRLKMTHKLEFHTGCVNALGFNSSGEILASGSDDLKVAMWDWARKKLLYSYESGHESNIFQVRFLPLHGDTHVVTSARDGAVRLGELSSAGLCKSTRRIVEHRAPVPKFAVAPDEPYVILSAAEDGTVFESDIREDKSKKLLTLKDASGMRIGLYSISLNPSRTHEFCVCGCDAIVRVYDRRFPKPLQCPQRFIPGHLRDATSKTHVTSAEYNHDGSEIAASYKDDDVFLFKRHGHSDEIGDFVKRYEGRRNNATVKSLSFFGPKSEYVVSGSDCGNIFFWDKETEAIVHFVHGDVNGVVNVPVPHPFFPVMASCGLDDEVKIWMPLEPEVPSYQKQLEMVVKKNLHERESDVDMGLGSQNNMLWLLWRHLRRARRSHRVGSRDPDDSSESDTISSDSSDSDDEPGGRPICTTT